MLVNLKTSLGNLCCSAKAAKYKQGFWGKNNKVKGQCSTRYL